MTAIQFYRRNGETYDPPFFHKRPHGGVADLSQVHFRGLLDTRGKLVAVATHNTDIADGWEREGEDEEFFQRFSVHAYALAINILTYAMSVIDGKRGQVSFFLSESFIIRTCQDHHVPTKL